MRARIRACLLLTALVLASAAEPAHALWPFAPKRTPGDTLSSEAWNERFRDWSARPISLHEQESTTSIMDSLQAVLDAADVSLSPSELAKMAALASQQQKQASSRQPPQPGRTTAAADSARAAQSAQKEAASGAADASTFAADDDTTSAGFPGETEDDSLDVDDVDAQGSSTPSGPSSPFGPRSPAPSMTAAFAGRGVSPNFSSNLKSTNDAMNLSTSLATTVADASGVSLTSTLTYGENISLTQNTETETRGIINSLLFPVERYGLSFNLNTTNSRSDRLGRGITNARTRNQSDNRGASLSGQAA